MLENNNNSDKKISRIIKSPNYFQNNRADQIEIISNFRRALPQFIAVGINNIILLVYGMTLGFPIIVIPAIQLGRYYRNNDLFLDKDQVSLLSSISLILVPLGSILSGFYSEYLGKKRSLQLVNIPIIISYLLYHFATNAEHLYLALGLSALSCGLIETPVLIYIAETVETKYRGFLSASGSIFILLGIIFQNYISSILHWRMVAAITTLFPVISIIFLFFIPETPIWLMKKNNLSGAIKSLKWFRGWVSENEIEIEFFEIYNRVILKLVNESDTTFKKKFFSKNSFKNFKFLKKKSLWYPFLLLTFMFFIGHFSGKTTLQTYTIQIFHTLKAPLKKFEATMILGLCEILGVLFCVVFLQLIGKRKLMFISCIGISFCFLGAGIYANFLYTIPGYAVNNIVNNAAKVPNGKIITTNILNIVSQNDDKPNQLKNNNRNCTPIFQEKTNLTDIKSICNSLWENINSNDNEPIYKFEYLTEEAINSTNDIEFLKYEENQNETIFKKNIYKNEEISINELLKISETNKGLITIPIPAEKETNNLLWIPLTLLFGAAFFAHIGLKTIPWILIGEIFPEDIRSYIAGITTGVGFFFGFLANRFFLVMLHTLSISGTFWFYSIVAIYGALFLYFTLPETENKSLQDIENYFSNGNLYYKNKIQTK